jgi:hypothetical protein
MRGFSQPVLQRRLLHLVVLLVVFAGLIGHLAPRGVAAITADEFCAEPAELENLRLVNELRAQYGLVPLQLGQHLSAAAEHHNIDMAVNNFFSHTGSDGSSFVDRARAHGYEGAGMENLAAGMETAQSAFDTWAGSSGHRANLLDANARWIGISRYEDTDGVGYRWYWGQVFGSNPDTKARACGETPSPTPTTAPTETPTQKPTDTPTQVPTATPTQWPSATPTEAPTQKPSATPTPQPAQAQPYCHRGRTRMAVPGSTTWNAHMGHGDTPGACPNKR